MCRSVVFVLLCWYELANLMFIRLLLLPQIFVTFRRIDDLLRMEEMAKYYRSPNKTENAVEFETFTGAWDVVEKNQVWRILSQFQVISLNTGDAVESISNVFQQESISRDSEALSGRIILTPEMLFK